MSGKKHIKTWVERCEEHPDHNGIVSERMIKARMQEEIDELREENERLREQIKDCDGTIEALQAAVARAAKKVLTEK